jgi:hypothetical protein
MAPIYVSTATCSKPNGRERALIEACFKIQQRFALDNVNGTPEDRSAVITAAHAARFRVIGYFFQVSTRVAIARNKAQIRWWEFLVLFGTYKRLDRRHAL